MFYFIINHEEFRKTLRSIINTGTGEMNDGIR